MATAAEVSHCVLYLHLSPPPRLSINFLSSSYPQAGRMDNRDVDRAGGGEGGGGGRTDSGGGDYSGIAE